MLRGANLINTAVAAGAHKHAAVVSSAQTQSVSFASKYARLGGHRRAPSPALNHFISRWDCSLA